MNELEALRAFLRSSRERTLGLLQKIEAEPDPAAVLAFRPGPGRAHIGWQLMHVAVTEELFATERLIAGAKPAFPELIPRFKGGSTPDENVPSATEIREVLNASRTHLESTLSATTLDKLELIPEPIKDRGWTLRTTLHVLAWHEAHHQGQAHLTFNLFKAQGSKG